MKMVLSTVVAILLAATALAVRPAAQSCDYRITGGVVIELDGASHAGGINIETQPGCAWTVDSSVPWVHPGVAGGTGSSVIAYQVDAAPVEPPLRQGFIRVRWNTPTAGQNIVVTQTSGPCNAIFTPVRGPLSARTIGWKGGSRSIETLAEPPFSGPWRINSAPDWITFPYGGPGLLAYGDGGVTFVAAPNPSAPPRDGVITFCSGATMTVHQSGQSRSTGSAVAADFDGDGLADPAIFRPSTGGWYALLSTSGYNRSLFIRFGSGNDIPLPIDFDGDNIAELAVYNANGLFGSAAAGNWNLRHSSNGYITETSFAFPYDGFNYTPQNVPLVADFNGDGKADLVDWRPDTGEWGVYPTDGRFPSRLPSSFPGGEYNGHWQWGLPGDVPVPADFDGDHFADLAVWRPSNGTWYIRRSSDGYSFATYQVIQWGLPGDRPVVGDFDGDGRADLIVWRPSNGTWYVLSSSQGYSYAAQRIIQWGLPGDIPVANDYDGDGRLDPAVWRPSNGTWYLLLSSQGYSYLTYRAIQWGLPDDIPLSARIIKSQ